MRVESVGASLRAVYGLRWGLLAVAAASALSACGGSAAPAQPVIGSGGIVTPTPKPSHTASPSPTPSGATPTPTATASSAAAQIVAIPHSAGLVYLYALPLTSSSVQFATATVPGTSSAMSLALDHAGNLYMLTAGSGATAYAVCPAPAYTCTPKGVALGDIQQWLAVDAVGDAFVEPGNGTVIKFSAGTGPTSTPTVVYDQLTAVGELAGLAVSQDGTTLYVMELSSGVTGGALFVCNATCQASPASKSQVNITTTIGAGGSSLPLAPPVSLDGHSHLAMGLVNPFGSTTAPNTLPISYACTVTGSSYSCNSQSATFAYVEGDLNPFVGDSGIGTDAVGNVYVATELSGLGGPTPPEPYVFVYPPGANPTGTGYPTFLDNSLLVVSP